MKSAAEQGVASCSRCLTLSYIEHKRCRLCDKKLYLRPPRSVQKTLALLLTALIFYIPANLYPIMSTTLLGDEIASTIIGGVVLFFNHGSYFVAGVIFTASIVIPIAKMMVILWLCYCVHSGRISPQKELTNMYQIVEFIGKWSMIDVFVVAVLVALVQITGIMSVHPGIASQAFAIVVILTMLSAQQFDIRLIWDNMNAHRQDLTPAGNQ
ncbi:paraquat-inducible protein A [Glaciecola sp. SC05]|uniref:paraquat-inducible protein A n=1 Tax=Glaciecola sp. SC05 TaxID=1987355 RepID=UPI00352893E1